MTEQEIINILKENKEKGVAYLFLPEQVRNWVHDKLFDKILLVLDSMGNFIRFEDVEEGLINTEDYDNVVFALPGDYEPKQESKGEWVEFDIEDSCFVYSHTVGTSHLFDWFDWGFFLKASKKQGWGFTAFGGWQYENDNRWYMAPAIKLKTDNYYWNSYTAEKEEVKPAIPVKIRFWRES